MQTVNELMEINRGDVYLVNLDPVTGKETGKTRPSLIVQNDVGNKFSPVTIIAPISSIKEITKPLPIMVYIEKNISGLKEDSYIDCGQIRTIDKGARLVKKITSFNPDIMRMVDRALKISLALK